MRGAFVAAALVAPLPVLQAQRPQPKSEVRADLIAGTVTAAHLGAAWNVFVGPYLRTALTAGGGPARRGGEVRGSGRVEALARFHLDPLRELRAGVYGSGGLGLFYDPFNRWRPRLVALLGVEFPRHGSRAWALEVGLGGGFRAALALRSTGATRP